MVSHSDRPCGFGRELSAMPFRVPGVEATGAQSTFPQETDCVVRVHAVRAAAVGDDLPTPRQGASEFGKLLEWRRTGTGDVAGCVLVDRANVQHHDPSLLQTHGELRGGDRLDPVAVAEVLRRQHLDL